MATVGELISAVSARFEAGGLAFGHGFDSAWDEAVFLVLDVTGLPDDRLVLDRTVSRLHSARIETLAQRRLDDHVPLAYLLGHSRFVGLDFLVEPGIVVPRSPIGALIAEGLRPWLDTPPAHVLDLCCGTGCIGIAAAVAFPAAEADLVDIDPRAVRLARRNAERLGVDHRVRVHQSDLFDDLADGRWDLILCNPPYVDARDMASLPAEFRHEPALGLAGGDDGLDLVVRVLDALPERLERGGTLVCEVGASAPALLRRYPDLPFVWPDLPDGGAGVFILQP
jgi:ribosomal protein L3 glutamine methyltransferase